MTLVEKLQGFTADDHKKAAKHYADKYAHINPDKMTNDEWGKVKDYATRNQHLSMLHGLQALKKTVNKEEAQQSASFSDPLGPGQGSPIHQSDPFRSMFYHQSMYNKLQAHSKEPHVIANDVKAGMIAKEMNHHVKMYNAHKRHADQQQQGAKK